MKTLYVSSSSLSVHLTILQKGKYETPMWELREPVRDVEH